MPQKLHKILNMAAVLPSQANGLQKMIEKDRLQQTIFIMISYSSTARNETTKKIVLIRMIQAN